MVDEVRAEGVLPGNINLNAIVIELEALRAPCGERHAGDRREGMSRDLDITTLLAFDELVAVARSINAPPVETRCLC